MVPDDLLDDLAERFRPPPDGLSDDDFLKAARAMIDGRRHPDLTPGGRRLITWLIPRIRQLVEGQTAPPVVSFDGVPEKEQRRLVAIRCPYCCGHETVWFKQAEYRRKCNPCNKTWTVKDHLRPFLDGCS